MGNSRNVIVICSTVMFCFILATTIGILHYNQDPSKAIPLVALLLTNLGLIISALALLIKGESTKQIAQDNNEKLDKVLNGNMAAQIKKAYKDARRESRAEEEQAKRRL